MKFDIVLSFAGEDRKYAEKLAKYLHKRHLKVFYDRWYQTYLWVLDLTKIFSRIYYKEAPFCVSIISKAYRDKPWTKYEMRYIRDRQFSDEKYWLPIIREDVEILGLRMTDGKIYEKDYDLSQIADMILYKVYEWKCGSNEKKEYKSDKSIMSIIKEDGSRELVEVVFAFEFKDNKKEYVIYTK